MSRRQTSEETEQVAFGRTSLDPEHVLAFRRARRLQRVSLVVVAAAVVIIMLVMGNSQAMKAAWVEDLLSFLPPLAFLAAGRLARRAPDENHPWGYHRAVGIGHLAASLALLVMGGFVVTESVLTLVGREHPTIGTISIAGHTFWQGWLMIAGLVVTGIPTVILGRLKMKVAEPLHDKILYADAAMMRADWMTSSGAIVGLLLIGLGWWWADAAVAMLIGLDIVSDGIRNVRHATADLMDATARTFDDSEQHPLLGQVAEAARDERGVAGVRVRMRDQGHLFHTEVFIVAAMPLAPEDLDAIRRRLSALDWKLEDLVVVPVPELPDWS